MRLFRRQTDGLEAQLRARRSEPRDEFVNAIVSRISPHGTRQRLQLVFGVAAAALGLAMFGAFGGLSYASSAGQSVVQVLSPTKATGVDGGGTNVSTVQATASTTQYGGSTAICHSLGNGRYTLKVVNNSALPGHKSHGDTLPGPGGTCPGGPIP